MKNKNLSFDDRLEIEKGQKKIIRMEITIWGSNWNVWKRTF